MKKTFLVMVTVEVDIDSDEQEAPEYRAAEAVLEKMPQQFGDGVELYACKIVGGMVNKDGVSISSADKKDMVTISKLLNKKGEA